jgi:hypothetical protein
MIGEQSLVASGMVAMVVGVENRLQGDLLLLGPPCNRFGFRGVNDPGVVGGLTEDEIAIVVS